MDNLVGLTVNDTAYTAVTDPLGSVRARVRRTGGVWVGRLLYDPYGQLVDSAGPPPLLRYRWTGREWDAETGWYFHRSRSYDPAVGRFVQEDRIGYSGGGNLYAYVNGDVLQARDPDGLTKDATWAYLGWDAMCLVADMCFGGGGELRPLTGGASYGQRRANALLQWAANASLGYDAWVAIRSGAVVPGSPEMKDALYECAKNAACAAAILAIQNEVRVTVTIDFGDPKTIRKTAEYGATATDYSWKVWSANILIDRALTESKFGKGNFGEVITHELGHVIDASRQGPLIYFDIWNYHEQEAYTNAWSRYYRNCRTDNDAKKCKY